MEERFKRQSQQEFGKFPGIVIIQSPEQGSDQGIQNQDNIHHADDRFGEIIAEIKQSKSEDQVEQEVTVCPPASG